MWIYEKRLEYPVNITKPDLRMAKLLMAQYGGPDSDVCAHKGINHTLQDHVPGIAKSPNSTSVFLFCHSLY